MSVRTAKAPGTTAGTAVLSAAGASQPSEAAPPPPSVAFAGVAARETTRSPCGHLVGYRAGRHQEWLVNSGEPGNLVRTAKVPPGSSSGMRFLREQPNVWVPSRGIAAVRTQDKQANRDDPKMIQSTGPAHEPFPGFRRAHPSALPVTGAWRPGDPVGARRFLALPSDRPFALEGGGLLPEVVVAYETWGTLSPDGDNAILVCHALTGDSHAAGGMIPGHAAPGWWNGFIGPGLPLDTDRYFVVCVNLIGGCQGSTGPASPHPQAGRPWGARFPVVSIRDMVRTQAAVADHLGIERWFTAIGGSMGGMQVLEWGVMYPDRVRSLITIGTAAAASPQQIGWWSSGRRAIRLDPRWRDGDYYDAPAGDGPHEGLSTARMMSMMTFRSDEQFNTRFGREVVEPIDGFSLWQRFQVERYIEYQGDKLVRRFDANSYLVLTKAMDLHDLARGRNGFIAAFERVRAPLLSVGISSDILYPPHQSREITRLASEAGVTATYAELDSPHGHDSFLIDLDPLGEIVTKFLAGTPGQAAGPACLTADSSNPRECS